MKQHWVWLVSATALCLVLIAGTSYLIYASSKPKAGPKVVVGTSNAIKQSETPVTPAPKVASKKPAPKPALRVVVGDSLVTEPGLSSNAGLLYFGGFEGSPWQTTMKAVISGGNEHYDIKPGVGYGGSRAMRTHYAAGSYGDPSAPAGMSATIFKVPLSTRGDMYMRYLVRFMSGFQFAKSGKLPGLAGGTSNTGGQVPTGYDGWSGRLDWTSGGGVISYLYVPGIKDYGLELQWQAGGQTKLLAAGKWECLELRYVMNTPGQANGVAQGWINGHLALDRRNLNFRSTPNLAIDNLLFSTFFGGGTSDFASPINQYADFDNFALGTQRLGCPK